MKRSVLVPLGAALLLAVLLGCSGSGPGPSPTPTPPTIGQIYITKGNFNTIFRFAAGANGNVSPLATINVAPHAPIFLALDVPHNRLAAVSFGTQAIVLIDNATAPGTPRVVSGAATTFKGPQLAALDGAADLLYVVDNFSTILVFSSASTIAGSVAPLHTIPVAFSISGIAVDPANDRLFIADSSNNAINVYDAASTLNGAAVVPSRIVSGANTQLVSPGPLSLDSAGHLVVGTAFGGSNVRVFSNAATITGNVAPAAASVLPIPGMAEIAVSPTGELYVADGGPEIRVFSDALSASGTRAAVRTITGPNTNLDSTILTVPPLDLGIAIDPTR